MEERGAADRRWWLVAGGVTTAVVIALFGVVVTHPFIAFDDAEMILRNAQVTDPFRSWADQLLTPRVGYVVPVTVGIEAALHALSGGKAWSFHAAAVLLHALCAVQLVAFARRLGARVGPALFGGLAFAVHPLVVQPVAWAICLKDLLMANLVLGATGLFTDLCGEGDRRRHAVARTLTAITLALAAMLAKPSATLLGFAWLAYLAARRAARAPVPIVALRASGVVAALGVVLGAASRYAHDAIMGVEKAPGWTPALPTAVLGRQIRHALWPDGLLILYAPPQGNLAEPDLWIGLLGILTAGVLAVRARRYPPAILLLGVAVATYLPTSGVVPFARLMSDSYAYVPLACMCALGALALEHAFERSRVARRASPLAAIAVLAAFAGTSHAQIDHWRGGAALWQPVVDAYPDLADAHRLLGDEQVFRGEPARAIEPYRRFFRLRYDPRYLTDFGSLLAMSGRVEDAECVLVEAFLLGTDPGHAAYDYAVLLAFHPDHAPRYPAIAKDILARFAALPPSARPAWPPALNRGLEAQRTRLRGVAAAPPTWHRRTCAILRGG